MPRPNYFLKRVLAIDEKSLRPDNPNIARTLNHLAGLYGESGHYDEAEPLLKRALTMLETYTGARPS